MTLAEKLLKVVENISDEKLCEIIDYAEYLKDTETRENQILINSIVNEYNEALDNLA